MFVFPVFVREFLDESLGRKSFRFSQILIKVLYSKFRTPHISLVVKTSSGKAKNKTGK